MPERRVESPGGPAERQVGHRAHQLGNGQEELMSGVEVRELSYFHTTFLKCKFPVSQVYRSFAPSCLVLREVSLS